uniref:RRM domain-containing protein n=1 Tax=Alexandrium monilatum TaxID=311494 RepID=A0A7S4PYY7_9DINO
MAEMECFPEVRVAVKNTFLVFAEEAEEPQPRAPHSQTDSAVLLTNPPRGEGCFLVRRQALPLLEVSSHSVPLAAPGSAAPLAAPPPGAPYGLPVFPGLIPGSAPLPSGPFGMSELLWSVPAAPPPPGPQVPPVRVGAALGAAPPPPGPPGVPVLAWAESAPGAAQPPHCPHALSVLPGTAPSAAPPPLLPHGVPLVLGTVSGLAPPLAVPTSTPARAGVAPGAAPSPPALHILAAPSGTLPGAAPQRSAAGGLPVLLGAACEQGQRMEACPAEGKPRPKEPESDSAESIQGEAERSTVMLRNLPNDYTRTMVADLLEAFGFAGRYNFLYLPSDMSRRAGLGYAFVNMVSPADAELVRSRLEGFRRWSVPSSKVCSVGWSVPCQGLEANIERYRNSPIMHSSVPDEFKPIVLLDGKRVQFPRPTKKLRKPDLAFHDRRRGHCPFA